MPPSLLGSRTNWQTEDFLTVIRQLGVFNSIDGLALPCCLAYSSPFYEWGIYQQPDLDLTWPDSNSITAALTIDHVPRGSPSDRSSRFVVRRTLKEFGGGQELELDSDTKAGIAQ